MTNSVKKISIIYWSILKYITIKRKDGHCPETIWERAFEFQKIELAGLYNFPSLNEIWWRITSILLIKDSLFLNHW